MTTSNPLSNQQPPAAFQQDKYRVDLRQAGHDQQVQQFSAWLHPDLRDLPGIDWAGMPATVADYLVHAVGDSPYAPHIALAVGTALGSFAPLTLRHFAASLNTLLNTIQSHCDSWNGTDLTREVWEEYVTRETNASRRRSCLLAYAALTRRPMARYLERLDSEQRRRVSPYLLPLLPAFFLKQYSSSAAVRAAEHQRREEQSAALLMHRPLLLALIQLRKQAAQRLLQEFREACRLAEAGEELPLVFSYEAILPEISRGARPVEEVRVEQRRAVLQFRLWNREAWTVHYPGETPGSPQRDTEGSSRGDARPGCERYFVQYLGQAPDLLWFGDLVERGVLMRLEGLRQRSGYENLGEGDLRRLDYAHALGMRQGFATGRPGLLTPAEGLEAWLGRTIQRSGAALFDPESLYRGCLFGAALATLTLTNGSRVAELLQVSAERFTNYQSEEQEGGQPAEDQLLVWLQHLLPKGGRTEEERRHFPISPQSYELLREIGALLYEAHGLLPVISPHQQNPKRRKLSAEAYLFQWQATFDGKNGALSPSDVGVLIQFILHGLEFHTSWVEPFRVTVQLFLYMAGRATREAAGAPADEVTYLLHHQRVPSPGGHSFGMAADFWRDIESWAANDFLPSADEKASAQWEECMRDVFEGRQKRPETTFGYCARSGLCLCAFRGSLNLRCPALFPNPANRPLAVQWREIYARRSRELEAAGSMVDAHQARLRTLDLADLIRTMDAMQQAIDDGIYGPPSFLPRGPEEQKDHPDA